MDTAIHNSMETAPAESQDSATALLQGFVHHVLEHGHLPASIYKFCKELGLPESEFYVHYNSFEAMEAAVWLSYHANTLDRLHAEEAYMEYSVREKWLAYYFTLLEEWKAQRSFITWSVNRHQGLNSIQKPYLRLWKTAFEAYAESRNTEGADTGEIANRPYIHKQYNKGQWWQALFVLDFWLKDHSPNFELTDAAVEKAVNFSMDVIGTNALDTAFDFAKFVWQNR